MKPILIRDSAQIASLHQHGGLKIKKLLSFSPITAKLSYTDLAKGILAIRKNLTGGDHPKLQNKINIQ